MTRHPFCIATHHASDWRQRHIDHWNRTGKCLRHYSIDIPPLFCEQCGKSWGQVMDGREGRARRRLAQRGQRPAVIHVEKVT